jgi:hypothetical protein
MVVVIVTLNAERRLFNIQVKARRSLDGKVRRAIDIHEGEEVDESAFKALVRLWREVDIMTSAIAAEQKGSVRDDWSARGFARGCPP